MKQLVIFGTGKISECVSYYFERDGDYQIAAYCCDLSFIKKKTFNGRPVVAFENIVEEYPPNHFSLFIAIGYHGLNRLRKLKCEEGLAKGYSLASYVSPNVCGDFKIGANSLLLDGAVVQPKVKIGNNVFVWGGAMIGHHAVIEDHCWVTGSANIGGLSILGSESFLGLNATIGDQVTVGARCLVGANTLITSSIASGAVFISCDSPKHRLNTDQFLKISTNF